MLGETSMHCGRSARFARSIVFGRVMALLLAAAAGLPGCVVDPQPFSRFTQIQRELGAEADRLMAVNERWAREQFNEDVRATLEGEATAEAAGLLAEQLLLERDPDDRAFGLAATNPPLFLTTQAFRRDMARMNRALVDYALALEAVAEGAFLDEQQFRSTAEALNSGARTAAGALGSEAATQEQARRVGIFSASATEAFARYIGSRQRRHLQVALHENHEAIEGFSGICRRAIEIAAMQLHAQYGRKSRDRALSLLDSRTLVEDLSALLDLNDQYASHLNSLRTLHEAYAALPDAHWELAAGLGKRRLDAAAFRHLQERLRALGNLADELAAVTTE